MRKTLEALLIATTLACAQAPARPTPAADDPVKPLSLTVIDQTLSRYQLLLKLSVTDRTEGAWTLRAADTEVWIDGVLTASNHPTLEQVVPASGTVEVDLTADAEPIKDEASLRRWAARGTTPIPVLLQGALLYTDGAQTHRLPFSYAGELRAPRLPIPKMNDAEVARYDSGEVGIALFLGVENQNDFPIHLREVSYHATLAGQLISEGVASSGDKIPPSQTAEYEIDATLDKAHSVDLSKLADEGKLDYHLDGEIDLGITRVPIHLTGPLTFGKKGPHAAKAKPTPAPDKAE